MNTGASGFYSAAQVRELDRRIIAGGTAGYELMQRAAAACWRELTRRWPKAQRLAVVCGPGNNGGDGFEIARLARAAGWTVTVSQLGEQNGNSDAAKARKAWLKDKGTIQAFSKKSLNGADVIVDAIFGIGLSRAPEGLALEGIESINEARRRGACVLAVDLPSGLDADRGVAPGAAVVADVTVSFIGRKLGLYTGSGPELAGVVMFDDLQAPAGVYRKIPVTAEALEPGLLAQALPKRRRTSHKGHHGHVLLVGGEQGTGGAILLAARAALRAGAGLVSVATHPAHAAALIAAQPELMVHAVEDGRALRGLFERATVLAVGPGLGRSEWSRSLWAQALSARQPMVVDADGLNWLAENPARREDWILTPHPGEAGRLLGVSTAEIQSDRPAAVRELQKRYGGVAVLKGVGTLVQGESLALCPHGNPGMAVGGTGDVLCGLIAGLLAQGLTPETAACTGVLVHALAGDRAAQEGERGMLPSDLLDELRSFLNSLSPRVGGEG